MTQDQASVTREGSRPTREECEAILNDPRRTSAFTQRLARAYIALLDAHQQTIQAAEKLAEALAARKCTCNGTGLQHKPGYTHYETDAGEECPVYHYSPCPRCEQARAALAQWEAVRRGK